MKARARDPDELIGAAVTEAMRDVGAEIQDQYRGLADFSERLCGRERGESPA